MFASDMRSQSALLSSSVGAKRAGIRTFPTVNHVVVPEVSLIAELPTAQRAHVHAIGCEKTLQSKLAEGNGLQGTVGCD